MPVTLGKNLHLCFTKIKNPLESESPSTSHPLVINNYNSLFESKSPPRSSSSSEPDFATVFASQRFFFSSPGHSNSIIESTPSIVTPTESSNSLVSLKCNATAATPLSDSSTTNQSNRSSLESLTPPTIKDSVAVPTYSPDPYLDFRRSMQEMVEARDFVDVKENWDYLHELLLCYLALNPKSTHKFIVRAFADLLVSLLASPSSTQKAEGG
ncbi:transcription repressor OFP16 [Ricinus communis]|uniref:Transcription repressor n=1 Tax=Ricinus communis TaxID=3988 RepID=B9S3Z8_RICCO|nr:transcription repressor OFP16 [Ricinus communis]EEF41679.1 conserved hypothetical protein [Ricinus communis]|eukprot:XP_002520717.1 transcription repressor OFP16 [Ricinus communis]